MFVLLLWIFVCEKGSEGRGVMEGQFLLSGRVILAFSHAGVECHVDHSSMRRAVSNWVSGRLIAWFALVLYGSFFVGWRDPR
jgi:hypothetical protein